MDADGLWKARTASTHSKNATAHAFHKPSQNRQTDAGFAQRPQATTLAINHSSQEACFERRVSLET
jgi:hypothetical protein